MHFLLASFFAFATLVAASPTLQARDPRVLFGRAIGSSCTASARSGTCQKTSECQGISYTGFCPSDPVDVKCCVKIQCTVSGVSGLCRSVSNSGCSGGTFTPGHCPGSSDIQCCTKPVGWPECQKTLSCTFDQIQSSPMQERLDYVRYMQSNFFGSLNAGNQFRAIEGVISFFTSNNLGVPGSWISYVDTGIIEGIQNGGAIALGMGSRPTDNPGTAKWAAFFNKMKSGGYSSRDDHDFAWGEAEATATEWSKASKADAVRAPTLQENNWYQFTKLFRWIMRHKTQTETILLPIFATRADDFVKWLTDITNPTPSRVGSQAAWAVASISINFESLSNAADVVLDLLRKLYDEFKRLGL